MGLSFVLESYLVLRIGADESLTKLMIAFATLLLVIWKTSDTQSNIRSSATVDFRRMSKIALLYLLSLGVAIFGASMELFRVHIDPSGLCGPTRIDYFELTRTVVVGPALETLIFVRLLSETFQKRFTRTSPVFGVIVVALLFSAFHFPNSVESFICRFCSAVIFLYIYVVMRSLTGAFVVHALHNFSLSALAIVGESACLALAKLPYDFVSGVFTFELLMIACLIAGMANRRLPAPHVS